MGARRPGMTKFRRERYKSEALHVVTRVGKARFTRARVDFWLAAWSTMTRRWDYEEVSRVENSQFNGRGKDLADRNGRQF